MTEFLLLFAPLALVVYLLYLVSRWGKTQSEPTNWPLVGMLPAVVLNLHRRPHDTITKVLIEHGGTYQFKGPWFCNLDMLFTCDPANIHHILTKNFSNYPKGPEFYKIFDIFGDGFFRSDFELWKIHRRTILSHLTHPSFATSLEITVWHKVQTVDYFCNLKTDFDLQDIFQRFTFDTICKLILDYDPHSLSTELPYVPSEKAFNSINESLLHRHVIPESIWKLQKWLKIGGEKKIMEAWETLDDFVYQHLENASSKLLQTYEKAYEEENVSPSDQGCLRVFLRDSALSLMFAGNDTVSTCLTWLFWLIALNPCEVIKIRQEIETVLQLKEDKKWRFFSVQESHKLVYLHGPLCESLRLFPPPALEHKSPARSDVLPSGHHVHKNARLIMSLYTMGRMESVWGKDCLEFKPDRWIAAGGGIKHVPSYKFAVFNAGPRACIGKGMALIEMKMVAATIIYHYNIKLVADHPVSPRLSIILQAKHGLRVKLSKRN